MKSNGTRINWNLFFIQNYQIFSIIRYFHWFTLSSYDYSYSYYFISQTALVLSLYPSHRTCAYNFKFFMIIFLFFSLAIPIQSDCRYHLAFVRSPSLLQFVLFMPLCFISLIKFPYLMITIFVTDFIKEITIIFQIILRMRTATITSWV